MGMTGGGEGGGNRKSGMEGGTVAIRAEQEEDETKKRCSRRVQFVENTV